LQERYSAASVNFLATPTVCTAGQTAYIKFRQVFNCPYLPVPVFFEQFCPGWSDFWNVSVLSSVLIIFHNMLSITVIGFLLPRITLKLDVDRILHFSLRALWYNCYKSDKRSAHNLML
jgi:hypothetical protein